MNTSQTRPAIIIATLLGIIAGALLLLVVYQGFARSAVLRDIDGQTQEMTELQASLRENTKAGADVAKLVERLGPRMRACSWNEQLPYMINQLTVMLMTRGVTIDTMQPEPMTTTKSIRRFPMRLAFRTDLTHLAIVLQDMKQATPLLKVERLTVRREQGQDGKNPVNDNKLVVEVTATSFIILDKNAPEKVQRTMPRAVKTADAQQLPAAGAAAVKTTAVKPQPAPGVPAKPSSNAVSIPPMNPRPVTTMGSGAADGQPNWSERRDWRNRTTAGSGNAETAPSATPAVAPTREQPAATSENGGQQ
ncbi:MAG: GspMb/PilO family protein [Armatimonadota bacterium]